MRNIPTDVNPVLVSGVTVLVIIIGCGDTHIGSKSHWVETGYYSMGGGGGGGGERHTGSTSHRVGDSSMETHTRLGPHWVEELTIALWGHTLDQHHTGMTIAPWGHTGSISH